MFIFQRKQVIGRNLENNNILYTKEDLLCAFKNDSLIFTNKDFFVSNVAIDSREVKNNDIFFAIKGERNDGHNFIQNAINNGAICIVCNHIPDKIESNIFNQNVNFIIVDDTIKALTTLAIYNRQRIKAYVIAITGNVGKTSTKCLIADALSHFFKTKSPIKNYNNHIGLPYTIANTQIDTEILVLEMGMNHVGEIEHLTKIAQPDIAIITTITPVHMEFMLDINTIVKAKAEIFNGLKPNGTAILNQENKYYNQLVAYAEKAGVKNIINIGTTDSHMFVNRYFFTKNFKTKYQLVIKENKKNKSIFCEINGLSYHNVFNTLFCFAVAKILKLNLSKIARIMSTISIPEGRGNIEKLVINGKKLIIINDAYNSSPEALKCALQTLSVLSRQNPKKRAIAIIGDMLELGEYSKQYHFDMVKHIQNLHINYIITVGQETKIIHDNLDSNIQKRHFSTTKVLIENIFKIIKNNDIILFKASCGMHFENVIKKLKDASM